MVPSPSHLGRLVASLALTAMAGTGACGQRWVEPEPTGSEVTYEPVSRDVPAEPPAKLPSAPAFIGTPAKKPPAKTPAAPVVVQRRGGSTVRYEPILDPDDPVDERIEPDEAGDDHDGLDPIEPIDPHEPVEPSGEPMGPAGSPVAPRGPIDPSIYGVHLTPDGLALPYPTAHMFRGFGPCRGKRHSHEAIDLGGVGPDWGIGTPIRSMARAEVLFIGTGADNPDDFGAPDTRDGTALRGDKHLPRSLHIAPYGTVHFFSSTKGRWRSGNLVITRVLEGPLAGHVVRYLHVAAVHPDVVVGGVVERGQELALMGGTGVMESAPHLHLDIQAPDGHRVDVAPLLGLAPTASCKVARDDAPQNTDEDPPERTPKRERTRLAEPDRAPDASHRAPDTAHRDDDDKRTLELRGLTIGRCKSTSRREDFTSGRFAAHTTNLELQKGQKVTIEVAQKGGRWKPRLQVAGDDVAIKTLATGKIGAKAVTVVTAQDKTTVVVTVLGWSDALPSDAAYELSVSEKCRR